MQKIEFYEKDLFIFYIFFGGGEINFNSTLCIIYQYSEK